jgi:two-component system sensor histidine kinase FlrB
MKQAGLKQAGLKAGPGGFEDPRQLADAFSEFISASALLENSYRDLQNEVAHLGVELAERNSALTRSLEENDRMRAALEQMIDSMPCGVLVLDKADSIVRINPEGRRLLGPASARARKLRDLSRLSQIDFETLLSGSDGQHDNEVCLQTKEGKRWLAIGRRELNCSPAHRSASATPLHCIWILRDITASKQAELEREAVRRATVLAEISTILAHEIRNPLASLELFTGLIAQESGESGEWIAHLRAGIRTLSGTVNNVLSMNGEVNPRLALVDLSACVESGVDFVQPLGHQSGVSLSFNSAEETLTIAGNEDGIRQIMLNLISNAIRHTAAGGRVHVATRSVSRQGKRLAIVEVTDTGCGISEELMEHLFEVGFSGTGETPGLGLAVCKRLMAQHGGEIRVSSRVGEGSSFQLEFPAL